MTGCQDLPGGSRRHGRAEPAVRQVRAVRVLQSFRNCPGRPHAFYPSPSSRAHVLAAFGSVAPCDGEELVEMLGQRAIQFDAAEERSNVQRGRAAPLSAEVQTPHLGKSGRFSDA